MLIFPPTLLLCAAATDVFLVYDFECFRIINFIIVASHVDIEKVEFLNVESKSRSRVGKFGNYLILLFN